jgi:hypothetical protein
MFTANPFSELSAAISPAVMQAYVALMILSVVGGTLFDMVHKQSATYFFRSWRKGRPTGAGELTALAIKTAAVDVLASGEFCNTRRRIAHLMTMYGFLAYAISTVVMVFFYTSDDAVTPAIWPVLWYAGALLVFIGGCWFWFFIRVDVVAEGHSVWRLVRADLFVVALIKSVAWALIWAWLEWEGSGWANVALALYLIATTILFGSVPWSKFSHMFYKPAAAFQRRVEEANGTRSNLPPPVDKPETFGSARQLPRHY